MFVIVGVRGTFDFGQRMFFQLLHHDFDRFFQLRVFARTPGGGFEIDFDINNDDSADYALFTTNSGTTDANDDMFTMLVDLTLLLRSA